MILTTSILKTGENGAGLSAGCCPRADRARNEAEAAHENDVSWFVPEVTGRR